MSKEMFAAWLKFTLKEIQERYPHYLDIIVYDDEIYQPHLGILLEMCIDCLEGEPLPKERTE